MSTSRGYLGGSNGIRDGRVAGVSKLALSGQNGLQNLPKAEKQTCNCHNFGSTNWNGVLQSCSPVNVNMLNPNINSSGPSESASRAPTCKSVKTAMSASH